jgi:hypothetical protein
VLQTRRPGPDLVAVWREITERRDRIMRLLAAELAETDRLHVGLSIEEAADVIWATNSAKFYGLLVQGRGWSPTGTPVGSRLGAVHARKGSCVTGLTRLAMRRHTAGWNRGSSAWTRSLTPNKRGLGCTAEEILTCSRLAFYAVLHAAVTGMCGDRLRTRNDLKPEARCGRGTGIPHLRCAWPYPAGEAGPEAVVNNVGTVTLRLHSSTVDVMLTRDAAEDEAGAEGRVTNVDPSWQLLTELNVGHPYVMTPNRRTYTTDKKVCIWP